jgi:hypothetical protein
MSFELYGAIRHSGRSAHDVCFMLLTGLSVVSYCSSCSTAAYCHSLGAFALSCLIHIACSFSFTQCCIHFVSRSLVKGYSTLSNHSILHHSYPQYAKTFSLIRKISNSQQPKDDMEQQATTDDVGDKREDKQQEEVDGTSYDPDADPRDPGSYYSFPHFAEE